MKQTRLSLLFLVSLGTAAASYLIARFMVVEGFPLPVSPPSFLISLAAIGVVLVILAVPILKYKRLLREKKTAPRVNPFYAVRVLLLAKASALSAAVFIGWHIGLLIYQLTAAVLVSNSVRLTLFGILSSFFLLLAGMVVERVCKLPGDPTEKSDSVLTS